MDYTVHEILQARILELVAFPDSSVDKESAYNAGNPFDSWVGKIPWRRDRLQYSPDSLVALLVRIRPQ